MVVPHVAICDGMQANLYPNHILNSGEQGGGVRICGIPFWITIQLGYAMRTLCSGGVW